MYSESAGWAQDMHDAMTDLRSQQERTDDERAVADVEGSAPEESSGGRNSPVLEHAGPVPEHAGPARFAPDRGPRPSS
jgi:hypothetical protein